MTDGYIRLIVTRGIGDLGLDPRKCPKPSIISSWTRSRSIRAIATTRASRRFHAATPIHHRESVSPRIKSLNYLAHILAKVEGIAAGVDEVIMLDPRGLRGRGERREYFRREQGRRQNAAGHAGILLGVTREAVLELAREAAYAVEEVPLTRYDLYTADEVFLTGTAAEVIAMTKLDARTIGAGVPGPVTKELAKRFKALATRGD